jgi:ABC-2 type transport system ATP-binding protein
MLAAEVVALDKSYAGSFRSGPRVALGGVDLRVPAGIVFGLIGVNGAGKTTLIKALLGVVRPSGGTVRVLGADPEDPRVRARIGYLPERLFLPHAWTPLAFLASIARLKGMPADRAAHLSLLARVGLASEGDLRMGTFSKGMKQRVGLAAALLGAPDLLVLDEPTDGVDPLGRVEFRRILGEERKRGATVLLNSHLLAETERVCDRIGILHAGKLVREGTLQELCGTRTRWRVRFAPGFDPQALATLGFRPAPEGDGALRCDAPDPTALDTLLAGARAAGALLVELGPDMKDLEDVLAESVVGGGFARRGAAS